jgi:farnesyl-diphosphate farnesyltransferase
LGLTSYAPNQLLTHLLRDTSRSFNLTLRVLPGAIRMQIGLAYLLARTTDTIADTEIVPVNQRLHALQSLRERILGINQEPLDFGELARRQGRASEPGLLKDCEEALPSDNVKSPTLVQGSSAERILLERIEDILAVLNTFCAADRDLIREVLSTITSGQELDLNRFVGAGPDRIVALATEEELDDYIWRVAGCVGEFWTRMCRAHLFPDASLDEAHLLTNGIRFGKGLQLVNILRDLPADLRHGRCYVPAGELSAYGLVPTDLLRAASEPRFRPLYVGFLQKAQAHLAAGWEYTNALPIRCVRVRLACAWPILIGVKTLARLRTQSILNSQHRIKITRAEVRRLVARSVISYFWPSAWRRLFTKVARS